MIEDIKDTIDIIHEKKPLILCLTNYVTMDFMANSLLALGAAPLMSESEDEIEELIKISQAVYLNLGTLNPAFIERAQHAVTHAKMLKKPIILDPVGAGASRIRTDTALSLMHDANVIRGNASEIMSLAGAHNNTRGVETADQVSSATMSARAIAQRCKNVVAISGAADFITDLSQEQTLAYGSPLMPLITGMGCTLTAVISAFISCSDNYYQGTLQALAYFSLCGQQVAKSVQKPGAFRQHFIDALYAPDWNYFIKAVEIKDAV